eukprot:TRINITY_DN5964_c0_g1_i2.p1 TRINITY_DN5964_c0_g1~~TRINITY_DN5964_c0_g1_i2.p1  ORF type:complete len:949 (-),score=136.32 TRINITY_DN5964_c0_g1_i2:219-3065(-)
MTAQHAEQNTECQHFKEKEKHAALDDIVVPDILVQSKTDQNFRSSACIRIVDKSVWIMFSYLMKNNPSSLMHFKGFTWSQWLCQALGLAVCLLTVMKPRQMRCLYIVALGVDTLSFMSDYVWPLIDDKFSSRLYSGQASSFAPAAMLYLTRLPLCLPSYSYAWRYMLWFFACCVAVKLSAFVYVIQHQRGINFTRYVFEVLLVMILLGASAVVSVWQRRSLDISERAAFMSELREKDTMGKLLEMLRMMLPSFALLPMLESADNRVSYRANTASVLFVVIDDFDTISQSMTPSELLGFLNTVFFKFDALCDKHRVTKIETVGEEFVCAVGVSPEDIQLDKKQSHRGILERLLLLTSDILSESTVTVRMGIQTGPVVAGVVGNKLPRFRLFGDTVNTAARMMQKGLPGKVQFGEETRMHLPAWADPIPRGKIEMKGKGSVMTYDCTQAPRRLLPESFDEATDEAIVLNVESIADAAATKRTITNACWPATSHHVTGVAFKHWFQSTFGEHDAPMLGTCHVLVLTAAEAFYVWYFISVTFDPFNWMFLLFVVCRACCCFSLWAWRAFRACLPFLVEKPWVAEIACRSTSLNLILLSYAGLLEFCRTTSFPAGCRLLSVSLLATYLRLIIVGSDYRFKETTVFTLLHAAPAYCVIEVLALHSDPVFTDCLPRLIFICSLMVLYRSFSLEADARKQWDAMLSTSETSSRMQSILENLLPPLVSAEYIQHDRCILEPCPPLTEVPSSQLYQQVSHDYREAIVVQSDLCGFTQLANLMPPEEVVELIGNIFSRFDDLAEDRRVYKIETVGDAYIAGQAEAPLTSQRSALDVISFGLDMLAAVEEWSRERGFQVGCRVGVHHGECIGGVVGSTMKRYHLFGRLMAVLEILESTSPQGCLQASEACVQAAEKLGESARFVFEKRTEPALTTSKGVVHQYDEVNGPTFLIRECHADP